MSSSFRTLGPRRLHIREGDGATTTTFRSARGNLEDVKALLVILLVILVLLLALPLAMGMDMQGGSCPACNGTERPLLLTCFAVLGLTVFLVSLARRRFAPQRHGSLAGGSLTDLFRPPRTV